MHAGFSELRDTYHTNFIAKYTGNIPVSDAAKAEIRKMTRIWNTARAQTKQRLQELGEKDEGFLFGTFSIADAFFWPVLWVSTFYLIKRSSSVSVSLALLFLPMVAQQLMHARAAF